MTFRTRLALSLFRWPRRLETALPSLLPTERLRALSLAHFTRESGRWVDEAERGLFDDEARIFDGLGFSTGRALCLACGAGREAFALARRGFAVTGIDGAEPLVSAAAARARGEGASARFLLGDLADADLGGERYDLITLLNVGYSLLPMRRARVALLARCREALAPGGRCVLSFVVDAEPGSRAPGWARAFGRLAGNGEAEPGDRLTASGCFVHFFPSPRAVAEEAREAGFAADVVRVERRGHFAVLTP